jgi:translation initiation factor 4E
MDPNTKLANKWNLWYHHDKDNWTVSGFIKIYEIETIADFWKLNNNWNKIKGINYKHYFLMKNDIEPIWENEINCNGGCWSFRVSEDNSEKIWIDLASYLICEQITNNSDDIVGLTICLKKTNYSVIKIWNKDSKNNKINSINKDIIKTWGCDIIYIAHMSENKLI